MRPRVLFILKFRDNPKEYGWDHHHGHGLSSGLLNSAMFIKDMLTMNGIEAKLVQVRDNNDIDREVAHYRPTVAIIEALWVVPSKFEVLHKLHPTVQWIVRGHSEISFLANEGVAMDWFTKYPNYENVSIAANSVKSLADLRAITAAVHPDWSEAKVNAKVLYLPNFYPIDKRTPVADKKPNSYLDVSCFGAIRPLKNQLIQGLAAIEYANLIGKVLRFHVNGHRTEQGGGNVLKNLRELFNATGHQLVEHHWMPHDGFLRLLSKMDMAMQVSFTESFNIVAADCTVVGLPLVISPEITWAAPEAQASPTDSADILKKMFIVNGWDDKAKLVAANYKGLRHFCLLSQAIWLDYFQD